uniref:Membrane transporter protein n=1 Tax=Meloidogyne hapla TaxID=6305 RepID=A0A1I8B1M6_MELHA
MSSNKIDQNRLTITNELIPIYLNSTATQKGCEVENLQGLPSEQTMWWTLAFRYNFFRLFPTHYELPLTMVVGATVAGMTSEGGGAVAFPVMTLLLHIETEIARDFSLMVQSCGMTSAAFTILWMRIKLEWHAIILCTIGSTAGIIFGLEWVDYLLTGSEKKMLFVSIWFSFAISLYVLNTQKKRRTHSGISQFNWWKATVLFVAGFIGGLCSAFAGSGVDICAFSVLTLLFRLSEKVATPTSANTCVGFFWRHLIMSEVSNLACFVFFLAVSRVGYWLDETERRTKLNGKKAGQIISKEMRTIRFKLPEN